MRAGFDVQIYERDPTSETRRQGYRITLDEHGIGTLRQCLPPKLFDLALSTASTPTETGYFHFTNADLGIVFRLTFRSDPRGNDLTTPQQFDRATLRAILLSGLEDRTHFGAQAVCAATDTNEATLQCADGRSVRASLVVGADGVHSGVRGQLLPGCTPIDTGSRAIYGRCPLFADGASVVPEALRDSGVLAVGRRPGSGFFFTSMRFGERPSTAFARCGLSAPAPINSDYVMWALLLPPDALPADVEETDPASLHQLALEPAGQFHPALQRFVTLADKEYTVAVALRAAQRPKHWPGTRVTLLGDAAHVMPPFESGGGNTSLRDAALLGARLQADMARGIQIPEITAAYQREMCAYAFPLVQSSVAQMRRINMHNPLLRWVALRLVPWVRSIVTEPLVPKA